jgi:hypothetical protein
MSNQLFVIQHEYGVYGLYTTLDKAKTTLKSIYNRLPDFKHYGYQINVYDLCDDEYKVTNISYTYTGERSEPFKEFRQSYISNNTLNHPS